MAAGGHFELILCAEGRAFLSCGELCGERSGGRALRGCGRAGARKGQTVPRTGGLGPDCEQ